MLGRAIAIRLILVAVELFLIPLALAAASYIGVGVVTDPNPVAGVALSELTATRERPVFTPSRRPPSPAPSREVVVAAAPPPQRVVPPTPPPFSLVGTVISRTVNIAIVKYDRTTEVIALKLGDIREGWTVSNIERGAVHLRIGDRNLEIALQKRLNDYFEVAADMLPIADIVPSPIMLAPSSEIAEPEMHSFGLLLPIATSGPRG